MLRIIVFLISLSLCLPALAGTLAVEASGGRETVTVRFAGTGQTKVFSLDNPPRLVIDVPVEAKVAAKLPEGYDGGRVKNIRSGLNNPQTQRIVLELHGALPNTTKVTTRNNETRIEIVFGESKAKGKQAKKSIEPPPPPEKPLIVIDAGHGGQDPGTQGGDGALEKDLVLAYARSLSKELLKSGKYRVKLTRDEDNFILLRERVNIARKAGASLFISLHADSAQDGARGLSIYTVSEKASDAEAEALAARENKVDNVYGMDLSAQSEDVADILVSLAQRDTMNKSAKLASTLVSTLDKNNVRLLKNAHRFAGFAVLKAPDIPSVLVEIGFLTDPEEERLLKTAAYREKLTTALARGVDAYFTARAKGAS